MTRFRNNSELQIFREVADDIVSLLSDKADLVHSHTNASTSDAGFMSYSDKAKLNAISSGATQNDTDSNLKNRSNHTGSQASSTISDFASAVDARIGLVIDAAPASLDTLNELAAALNDDPHFATTVIAAIAAKADSSALSTLASRVTSLENWKSAMPIKKAVVLTGTTDAAGKINFNLTSHSFTSAPKLVNATIFNNEVYSLVMNNLAVSTTLGQVCFLREKNTPVLLGGNITPSEPYATQPVTVIALEF